MSSNDWIHDLLSRLTSDTAESELRDVIDRYRREHDGESDRRILGDVDILLATLKELKKTSGLLDHKLSSLSETEREELRETERLIDENLFDYYFQPIVSTADGEIYSYEALMRPKSTLKLTPLHILKYAGSSTAYRISSAALSSISSVSLIRARTISGEGSCS